VAATVDYDMDNGVVNTSRTSTEKSHFKNDNSSNNVNISNSEFRTISLGIHSELAKMRTFLATRERHDQMTQKPLQRESALDIARQITNLSPDPLFITVGYNGCDMCVVVTEFGF